MEDASAAVRSRREHKAPTAYDPSEEAARAQWGGKDAPPPAPRSTRRPTPSPRAVEAAAAAAAAAEARQPAITKRAAAEAMTARQPAGTKRRTASPKPTVPEAQRAASPSWERELVRALTALCCVRPASLRHGASAIRVASTDLLICRWCLCTGRRRTSSPWINLGIVRG
jgi:hypothetical protein